VNRWLTLAPLAVLGALAVLFGFYALKHDPHVQPQPSGRVRGLQREGQRRVARTRAEHHVAHAAANQFVDGHARLGGRWVHHYSVSHWTRPA